LEDVIRSFGFLEAHTVDDYVAYVFRWNEAVHDVSVGATLDAHHMFEVVRVADVVSAFSLVFQRVVLASFTVAEHGVHLEGQSVVVTQGDRASEFGFVDFVLQHVVGVLAEINDEHVKEASWSLRGENTICFRRESTPVFLVEHLDGRYCIFCSIAMYDEVFHSHVDGLAEVQMVVWPSVAPPKDVFVEVLARTVLVAFEFGGILDVVTRI